MATIFIKNPYSLRFLHWLRVHLMKSSMLPNPVRYNFFNCKSSVFFGATGFSQETLCCRYVNKDREITKKFVQHAEKRGIRGLFITVDAPQLGRREKVRLVVLVRRNPY